MCSTVCTRERIVFIPWAPIARGSADRLENNESGKGLGGGRAGPRRQRAAARDRLAARQVTGDAADPGNFLARAPEENVAAARLALSAAEMSRIG